MKPRDFLHKLIALRKRLIKDGKSNVNQMKAISIIERLENFLKAYPNASEEGIKKIILKYRDDIKFLIPAGNSQEKWINELKNI